MIKQCGVKMGKISDLETGITTNTIAHRELTNWESIKTVAAKSGPFTLSRVIYTLNTLSIGWALSQLSRNDVAAGPFFTSLQYVLVGIPRGMVLSTGILIGEKNGAKEYKEVGKISRASWELAALASSLSILALLSAPTLMQSLGLTSSAVSRVSQNYLHYYSMPVPAILASAAEQQLAVATKDPKVPLAFSTTYSGVSAGLGIPMALGLINQGLSGVKGFGISTTIASWLGFTAMRLYYACNNQYKKYDLFRFSYERQPNYFKQLVSLGWKIGLQSGAEFANLMGTSIVISSYAVKNNIPALEMMAPLLQISSAWGLISLGYGQALATLIANERGVMRKALEKDDHDSANAAKNNIRLIGHNGVLIGAGVSTMLAAACLLFPSLFASVFLHNDLSDEQMEQACNLLQVNALGLIFDMMRNTYAGNLKGFKDVNFATISSFLLMTLASLLFGSIALSMDSSLETFTWIRNGSIALSMLASAVMWSGYNNLDTHAQARVNTLEDADLTKVSFTHSLFSLIKQPRKPSDKSLLQGYQVVPGYGSR